MKVALEDIPEDPPAMPSSLVTVRIDKNTGLQVSGNTGDTLFEIFRPGNEPPFSDEAEASLDPATNDTKESPGSSVRPDDLF